MELQGLKDFLPAYAVIDDLLDPLPEAFLLLDDWMLLHLLVPASHDDGLDGPDSDPLPRDSSLPLLGDRRIRVKNPYGHVSGEIFQG